MTEGVTLVNGQDALDGSVQIGKQTDKPDVPILEYQYAPVSETKDPDVTLVLSDQNISDAELRVRQLSDVQRSISDNGVNYEAVVALENISPGIIMNNYPELGYTKELSKQSFEITLERIDGAKLGGIVAAILVLIASIIALFKKFTNKVDRAADKVMGNEQLKELQNKVSEKVPSIQSKAKSTEDKIKRNAEANKWLVDNGIVDIIQLHGRLSNKLNVDEAVKNLPSYLKQVGYGDPTRNVLFNIDNIIGAHMPNVFYRQDLEVTLRRYLTFLNEFPPKLRKRLESISALNNAYAQVKYGLEFVYVRDEAILIDAIRTVTGASSYNSEDEAITDLNNRIREDWAIRDHSDEVTRSQVSKVINSSIKPIIIKIIAAKDPLEEEFEKLERFRKIDLNYTMNSLENTRKELTKLINATYVTDEKKQQYRDGLKKLEAAPGVYQAEFKLMARLASITMSPIINVARATLAMSTRVNMYYELLDRLDSILRRFEKEFGEDIE
jgi:hypothetical protein